MSLLFMYLWVRCLVLSRCTLNYPERIRGYAPFMVGLNKRVYCSDDGASLGLRVLLVVSLSAIRKGSKTVLRSFVPIFVSDLSPHQLELSVWHRSYLTHTHRSVIAQCTSYAGSGPITHGAWTILYAANTQLRVGPPLILRKGGGDDAA